MAQRLLSIGIDDMAIYVPKLFLDIKTLAEKRDIPYEKLSQGLGCLKMAICDVHEDAATMAAEAIAEIIERNQLDPRSIGRIYLGTESALDMAKPTGTYAVEMLTQRFSAQYGPDCFRHCDVLDMTFACIGATDALQNTLDWVAGDPERIGIVVASDVAKYELHSTGEYTQGAGAVAMLVRAQPRLLRIRNLFGVAMESVHDFFKPRRERFCETPVFDGQFSNLCYQNRMTEALGDFRRRAIAAGVFKPTQYLALSERWSRMIFHLPYAFHAKRMFIEQFVEERKAKGTWEADLRRFKLETPQENAFPDAKSYEKAKAGFLKKVSESALYKRFVAEKLEKAQRASQHTGNLYTASIFQALMSSLESDLHEGIDLAGKRLGFVAYGSGSKAKVFEAVVQPGWAEIVVKFNVFLKLEARQEINYDTYERLHTDAQRDTVYVEPGRWGLESIGTEGVTLGARYYKTMSGERV
ncbi:MAG: hydroxymethylglutaryl-CoA synthase family protein [Chitinophagales bacterium]|nr:hydroxymethylglutaryl-CoA synthase family protein [Chitinophagales bacterium]